MRSGHNQSAGKVDAKRVRLKPGLNYIAFQTTLKGDAIPI